MPATKAKPKARAARAKRFAEYMLENFRNAFAELRAISGQISQLGHMVEGLKARIPDTLAKTNRFGEPIRVTSWKIARPLTVPMYNPDADRDRQLTEPAELAVVLFELVARADTLGATNRIASVTFDEREGKLELYARERLT